jgi:tetratricopeptide (TPR) repeat protein
MSTPLTPEHRNNDLYYQCFEQLLPIAGQQIQAVDLDWWNLDRFLGLAFHVFLTETKTQVRTQIAQLLPKFGAKAVMTLTVILRHQAVEADLKALAAQSLNQIEPFDRIRGLINVVKASEDNSFDQHVAGLLADIGPDAIAAVEALLNEPESQAIALRILPQLQRPSRLATLEEAFAGSPNLAPKDISDALLQMAATHVEAYAYRQAIEIYSEVIDLCPDHARAYGDRGLLYANLGDQQAAISDFEHAAQLFHQQGRTANFEVALGYLNASRSRFHSLV